MKEMDEFLTIVGKGLRQMAKGVESMAKKVETYASTFAKEKTETQAHTKPKTKPAEETVSTPPSETVPSPEKGRKRSARKGKRPATAIEEVFQIISEAENGVTVKALADQTGFDAKKVHNVIFKLKRQGRIQSVKRGVYVKA